MRCLSQNMQLLYWNNVVLLKEKKKKTEDFEFRAQGGLHWLPFQRNKHFTSKHPCARFRMVRRKVVCPLCGID